jgi:hypothetical protein
MRQTSTTSDREAYRGYLIQRSLTGDTWYISKDGCNIGSGATLHEARFAIDCLLE